jgi:prophage tail gpP-like protein
MSLNDPYAAGSVRQPRMQILVNKEIIGGAASFEVHENAYYEGSTFSGSFSLNLDPAFDLGFWDAQENPLFLDIQASLDAGQTFTSQILGKVDRQIIQLEKGLIEVNGRDMTAVLTDAKIQKTYQNLTSSQVVKELAASHGMSADVTPTTTLVGRYYEIDHEYIGLNAYQHDDGMGPSLLAG